MSINLTPADDDDSEALPLGFQAGEDFERGGMYEDEYGSIVSAHEIDERLASEGEGTHKVGVFLRFRMPGDNVEKKMRTHIVTSEVVGPLTRESLGRIVHEASRSIYRGIESGATVFGGGDTGSETPAEVFVSSITIEGGGDYGDDF